jgi:hypothetical protein
MLKMDPSYIIAILFTTLIFIVIPLTIIFFVYRILKNKSNRKTTIFITITLFSLLTYTIYYSFNPSKNFYINNFEENTLLDFPKSAKFIDKTASASIYDFGGKNISSLIELNEKEYEQICVELISKNFKKKETYLETEENEKLLLKKPNLNIERIYGIEKSGMNYEVLFLSDKKTIILNNNQS